jgi:hypothetical protein
MKNQQIITAFSILMLLTANISAQSGGTFAITQSVIATGGQQSSSGIFAVDGTIGQSIAGESSANGGFDVRGGFWQIPAFAPTASMVSIGGRVRTAQGSGIRNVIVTLTEPNGAIRTAQTGSFGYFRFDGVAVGATYLIGVSAKRYAFAQPTIVRSVQDEIADLDFVADDL